MSLFSKNLRFLRKKGNYMQEDLARLFDKKANTIGNWENRKSEPGLSELMTLAGFFQVTAQDLLFADLEGQTGPPSATYSPVQNVSDNNNVDQAVAPNLEVENRADSFWLILKELRSLHDKMDAVVSAMENNRPNSSSDKSYY